MSTASSSAQAIELYVAPSGRDDWNGAAPEPNARKTDGPLATIARARDAARKLRRAPAQIVRVWIREGTYFLDEPLVFGPEDSFTTYAAFGEEKVIVSAGRRIDRWDIEKINGLDCWVAHLPEVARSKWRFTQLFVNAARRLRPRLPREGFYRFAGLPEGHLGLFKGARSAHFNPGDIHNWASLHDVEVVALQHWFESHLSIESVDESQNLVRFAHPAISDLHDERKEPARYFVENVFEELTEPGQWYLDTKQGRLYYIPHPGETPDRSVVIAPRLAQLVRVQGRPDRRVSHLRFQNIVFRHAHWALPRGNPGAAQASYNVPGAIVLRHAQDCVFFSCEISQLAQYGIEIQRGSTRNSIIACTLCDLGAGAVRVDSERPMTKEKAASTAAFVGLDLKEVGWQPVDQALPVDAPTLVSSRTTISDCTIHDCGVMFPSSVTIWIGDSGHNRVRHNHIYNVYYTAVSAGWTWGYEPARALGNMIEFNHIHDVGRAVLSDMGGIYLLGSQPGTIVRGNVIHDVTSHGYGGWGIYLDEGCSYVLVEQNIVYRAKSGGFHIHYGRDNVVRNNIFALGVDGQIFRTRCETVRSFTFENNIVYHDQGVTIGSVPHHLVFRRNVYFNPNGPLVFGTFDLEEWQQFGHDQDSVAADPMLADPHEGQMSLHADSPALRLGFVPIDAERARPRLGASLEQQRRDDHPPAPIVETRLEFGSAESWRDAIASARKHQQVLQRYADAGEAEELCLMLRNVGDVRVEGSVKLHVTPAGAAVLRNSTVRYDLEPGKSVAATATITLAPGSEEVTIEACDEDGRSLSALYLQRRRIWEIPSLHAPVTPSDVPDHLEQTMRLLGSVVARVGLWWAGEQLALRIWVWDSAIRRADDPLEASHVELLVSPADSNLVHRIALVPACHAHPDQALRMGGDRPVALEDVSVKSWRRAEGYELIALVPVHHLGLKPEATRFAVEIAAAVTRPNSARHHRASLGGNPDPWNASGFGTVQIRSHQQERQHADAATD